MSAIRLEHVSRRFSDVHALEDVCMEIRHREVVTIVGPSGCGKSTLLRIIAGLDVPTSGTVVINDQLMNDVPARQRNVAMVFQSYALYPHMTCFENLALNLRLKKVSEQEISRRVRDTARTLEIEDLLGKKPKQLSGGQRQRVAVGRALIRNPSVFLFDEPLSNLDASLRERVRHELKELFTRISATVVYVTHDQIEALTLANRVVVLDKGRVQQVGTPDELYRLPHNRFVASFIGSPSMNLFDADFVQGRFTLGGETIDTGWDFSGRAEVGIRPEAIHIDEKRAVRQCAHSEASISWVESLGLNMLLGLRVGSINLTALAAQRPHSDSVHISFDPKEVHVFEKDSGANIRSIHHRRALPA